MSSSTHKEFFEGVVEPDLPETKKREEVDPYKCSDLLQEEYPFVTHPSGEVYFYSNGVYMPMGRLLIAKLCRKYWKIIKINSSHINEIVNIVHDETVQIIENPSSRELFNQDYHKLILKNGMFDLKTMQFKPFDQSVLSTVKHPIFYNDKALCPKFDRFLKSCFDGDKLRMNHALDMMALCFIKKNIMQKGYVNYGTGSNGKSTLLKILETMLGKLHTCAIEIQGFQKNQFVGYNLLHKCANLSPDGDTEVIKKTGFLKSLLAGDSIDCEQKYKDPFKFTPYCTMIFTFNELPVVQDSSDGFARKIQMIHWDQKFYGAKRDHGVDGIAYDPIEKSGILNKLLPIMKKIITTKKLSSETDVDETKSTWMARSDSWYKFKTDRVVLGANFKMPVNILKKEYAKFCDDVGMTSYNQRQLYNAISTMLDGAKSERLRINGNRFHAGRDSRLTRNW